MTMIRTLLCAILLGAACQVSADTLYKWTEADGSITFSPEPPAAGVAYDTVETGAGSLAIQRPQAAPQQAQLPSIAATPAVPPQPAQDLAYAPSAAAAALPEGMAWEKDQQTRTEQTRVSNEPQTGVISSSKKTGQCLDLEKRVVSLERRLRSKLSPNEVDNTVVAIVRYQHSFDQYCG